MYQKYVYIIKRLITYVLTPMYFQCLIRMRAHARNKMKLT